MSSQCFSEREKKKNILPGNGMLLVKSIQMEANKGESSLARRKASKDERGSKERGRYVGVGVVICNYWIRVIHQCRRKTWWKWNIGASVVERVKRV